jgi:hypothetical protein
LLKISFSVRGRSKPPPHIPYSMPIRRSLEDFTPMLLEEGLQMGWKAEEYDGKNTILKNMPIRDLDTSNQG